ncbi:MAG: nucleotidyltransferase domain-containing protein [Anaerolineales bacterium]|nr:nucleotidyltransferase domain-containing protein [Chloroflexota bacterium]MBL6981352.1 nucleotidyltransferase domain-containing protein [Anaerolineales bacterium]
MRESALARLSEIEQVAVKTYVQDIRKQYPDQILAVALFGSKARGDDDPESDIDLLVITNSESYDFRSALWRIASEISLNNNVLISAHIFSQERWERLRKIGLPFSRAILADRIPLALEETSV